MIAQEHRFHGQRSLSWVYRQGQTARNQQLSVKYALNRRRPTYRAAVIVSKKVSKLAVERNRIRRRIYEVIRANEPDITEPYDIVLTVFSEQLAEMAAPRLTAMVVGLLIRAHIVKGPTGQTHAIVKSKEDGS